MTTAMTHSELIHRADRWLRKSKGCGFTLVELVCLNDSGETPDAIGWRHNESHLVECKVSRSDFISDNKKLFRRRAWWGMGDYRYYMTTPDLVKPDDLPNKWGLLYVYPKQVREVVKPEKFTWWSPGMVAERERPILISALRRVFIRGDLIKIYNQEESDENKGNSLVRSGIYPQNQHGYQRAGGIR